MWRIIGIRRHPEYPENYLHLLHKLSSCRRTHLHRSPDLHLQLHGAT